LIRSSIFVTPLRDDVFGRHLRDRARGLEIRLRDARAGDDYFLDRLIR
jgi:hypothetical protein